MRSEPPHRKRAPIAILAASLLCLAATEPAPLAGMWGAGNALLALDAEGGRLQIGCTLARFGPLRPGPDGAFRTDARVETLSLMPPVSDGDADEAGPEPATRAATLTGRRGSGTIDLMLAVEGEPPRSARLTLGQRGTPARCL